MKQYEYKCVKCDYSDYYIKECLEVNGKEGWELCASYEYVGIMLIFKREKKNA